MGRESSRKLATDPNMVHTQVLRQFNGDVSMDSANSVTSAFAASSETVSLMKFDDYLAYTSAQIDITATANSPTTVALTANGVSIVSTASPTAAATASTTQVTHTTVLRQPTYQLQAANGTASGTVTVTRENRIA